jgi:hypothetical protein
MAWKWWGGVQVLGSINERGRCDVESQVNMPVILLITKLICLFSVIISYYKD